MSETPPMTDDECNAFICACKGEPYTLAEWDAEVVRLSDALIDAQARQHRARVERVCLPKRFDPSTPGRAMKAMREA